MHCNQHPLPVIQGFKRIQNSLGSQRRKKDLLRVGTVVTGNVFSCLINRVDVFRGYDLHIDFSINYQQFLQGLDCIEAA